MKTKIANWVLGLSLLTLLLVTQVNADDQDFFYEENSNQVTFKYYDLEFIAKAGGSVPKFQFLTESGFAFETAFSFNIMFQSLTEYMDYNEDGVFQYDETGIWKDIPAPNPVFSNTLTLSGVKWTFSGFTVDYTDITEELKEVDAVHFTYSSESVTVPNYSEFEMDIIVHMYLNNQTIEGYEIFGGAEMKFDIVMRNWSWQRNDTNLALRFDIMPTTNTYRINDTNGHEIDCSQNTAGSELKIQNHAEDVKEQFMIGGEQYRAFFAYANQAKYNISNQYQYRTVNASYSTVGDGSIKTYISFEHFDEEVIYDPSIGSLEGPLIEDTDNSGLGTFEIVTISLVSVLAIVISLRIFKRK
ncbi:MAG: hypothetical protein HGN29_08505 [Asgard group archaeon]|nr:hypothetical protein [Asgard group archaeon]